MLLFDKNQKSFPSYIHKCIWSNGLLLVPPDISLQDMVAEQKEACLALYQYKADMFTDIYQNPELYHIDIQGILAVMDGKPWHKARLSAKWNKYKSKLNKLDELEQINLPHMICRRLLDYMKSDGGSYFIDKPDYDKFFVKQTFTKCNYKISEADFLSALKRCGLSIAHDGDKVCFTNDKYPLMFAAIAEWQRLLEPYRKVSTKKYRYDSAFTHLDYRFFLDGHSLTFDNSKWYMSDETIAYLSGINEIITRDKKAFSKLDNTIRIAIGFRMKSGGFFEFENSDAYAASFSYAYPTVLVKLFKYNSAEHMAFEERINKLPNADEVRTTFLKWVRRCNRCPCRPVEKASMIGNPRVVFGRNMKLCGPHIYLRTTDLCEKSFAIMKTILELG